MSSFPYIDQAEHPSGCADLCPQKLHLTPAALSTLRRGGVSEAQIQQALAYELAHHTRLRSSGLYPVPPGQASWNPNVERTLLEMGVEPGVIASAQVSVESHTHRNTRTEAHAILTKAERERAWRAENRAAVAAHSRAYRARKRLELVR